MYRRSGLFVTVLVLALCSAAAQTTISRNESTAGSTRDIARAATGSDGSDAGALINSCLQAAVASGTNICDARSLTGTRYRLSSNMAANIARPVQLLLAPGTIFAVGATQVLPAGFVMTVANGGTSTGIAYPGSPTVDFDWTGAKGGTVFDLKDAPNSKLEGLLVDCNHIAAVGVNLSGGILDTFYPQIDNSAIQDCTYGAGVAIDNYGPALFNVTMAHSGGILTGTLTDGSFSQDWVGKTSSATFAITGASAGNLDTPTGMRIAVHIASTNTFTASIPHGRWNPSNASGVRGTLESYSEAQDWICYSCNLGGNKIGYRTASAGARIVGGGLSSNAEYGIELYGYGQFFMSDGVFSGNGTDIYIASSGLNTLAQTANVWFENSSVGVLGAASGVTGYTVDFTNANLHSSSPSGLVDVSAAGAGTINFVAATINPLTRNASIRGNAAATVNYGQWSVAGITTPTVTGFSPSANAPLSGTTITATTQFSGPGTGLTGTAPFLNIGGTAANLSGTPALPNGVTASTQRSGDTSARPATDAFVANTLAAPGAIGATAAATSVSTRVSSISSTQTTVPCSTSGNAYFSEPEQGTSFKVVVINLSGCTGTATYSYPTAYILSPSAIGPLASLAGTPSRSGVTITAGSSSTGALLLVGF